jgi:hypothetical protein
MSDVRSRHRRLITTAAVTIGLGVVGAGSTPAAAVHAGSRARTAATSAPAAGHVFVIVGENTSLGQLTRGRAPYLTKHLKPKAAWLNGYRALAHSSSTGDYIEMTSGQSIKCERNDSNPVNPNTDKAICHQKVNNIFNQLQHKHISWKDWEESMPHACAFYDDGTDWAGDVYGAHHNPAIYYDPRRNASTTWCRWARRRTTTRRGSIARCAPVTSHGSTTSFRTTARTAMTRAGATIRSASSMPSSNARCRRSSRRRRGTHDQ